MNKNTIFTVEILLHFTSFLIKTNQFYFKIILDIILDNHIKKNTDLVDMKYYFSNANISCLFLKFVN